MLTPTLGISVIKMSLITSNWNYLGNQFYKKFEMCKMLWNGMINLEDYIFVAAQFGGPIGTFLS